MSPNRRIATCQFEPEIGDIDSNCNRIAELVASLDDEVALAAFPELCLTGYDLEVAESRATPVPGELTDRLVEVAEVHDLNLVVGIPERGGSGLYNTLVHVDSMGVQAVYRKQYPWGDESTVFSRGSGPITVETVLGTVGFLTCYDLNFPEAALAYARLECDVLVVSAAWRGSYIEDWKLLLRSRALDGTCYVVGTNHIGTQRGRQHGGCSLIADPCGTIIETAGKTEGSVATVVRKDRLREGRLRNPVATYRRRSP